jgi:hypothetical protein
MMVKLMIKFLGKEYTKENLKRYASNLNQISGITKSRYVDGKADGMENYTVKTGAGLEYTALSGRCLDLSSLSYRGINISYLAKPGIVSPQHAFPSDSEFGRYFTGGMMVTCGLQNAGEGCIDEGLYNPPHGRIGLTPAEDSCSKCYWENEEYKMELSGTMREGSLFHENLMLMRRITSKLGLNELEIHDTLENNAAEEEKIMILYHFNFGFPFLDENVKITFPENKVLPRTEGAVMGINESERITAPQDNFTEHVFSRNIEADKDGFVTVKVENERLGIGVYIKYEKKNLPVLIQWKSMRSGDYVLGIEPGNSYINGRKKEAENGTIKSIKPFSALEYSLKLGVYDL